MPFPDQITRETAERELADHDELVQDLMRSTRETFLGAVRRLVQFQRSSAIFDYLFAEHLRIVDLEKWLNQTLDQRGGVRLDLPEDKCERLGLEIRLLTFLADHKEKGFALAQGLFPRSGNIETSLGEFKDQILRPTLRDYCNLATQEVRKRFPMTNPLNTHGSRQAHAPVTQVEFHGPVSGAVQISTRDSIQNVSISLTQVQENVNKLRGLLKTLSITELEQEDVEEALHRIEQLASKEKTTEVVKKANEKLQLIKNVFQVCKEAGPWIISLAEHFTK